MPSMTVGCFVAWTTIAVAFSVQAKPYTIPAHWVESENLQPLRSNFSFEGLSFTSPTEGWILANRFLLHVIGDDLELTFIDDHDAHLWSISFSEAADGWAAGWIDDGNDTGLLWRYQGGWKRWDFPNDTGAPWSISRVRFGIPNDGYLISSTHETEPTLYPHQHFSNGQWRAEPERPDDGTSRSIIDMCFQGDDVWAVGWKRHDVKSPRRGLVARRHDGIWQDIPVPAIEDDGGGSYLNQVACVGQGFVAKGKTREQPRTGYGDPLVLAYDGSWKNLTVPPPYGEEFEVTALAATAFDDVWISTSCLGPIDSCHNGFQHWTGTSWEAIPAPTVQGHRVKLNVTAISFPSADSGWAIVGNFGVAGMRHGLILRYENGVWRNRNWNWHFWHQRWFGLFGD